jgi:hypothetical protein
MRNINSNSNNSTSIYSVLFAERAEQANTIKREIETGVFLSTKSGKPVKVNSLDSFNDYLMQQHGRMWVGKGYYSNAYVGGEGLSTAEYVLKIKSRDHDDADPWFDAYGPYCYQNKPTNPLFPKVLYVGQPVWSDQPIALVEKLTFDPTKANKLSAQLTGYDNILDAMQLAIMIYSGKQEMAGSYALAKFPARFDKLLKALGSDVKDFTEFAHVIIDMADSDPDRIDIHENNLGWRDNGELVMSDPLA